MVGGILHNYTLPFTKFQFIAAPFYSAQSKSVRGIGRISYRAFTHYNGSQLIFFAGGASFSNNQFIDSLNEKHALEYDKSFASVKYVFKNENPRSLLKKYIQFKSFHFAERNLSYNIIENENRFSINYPLKKRFLNQWEGVIQNDRVLYPYKFSLNIEQANQFTKGYISSHYFFNYVKGGGLQARFFGGIFMYAKEKTSLLEYETDRFHYNMSGADGNEDYTYARYFVGRNELDGFSSRQMVMKDGAFKVKTSLLSNKIGKSDSWLAALNLLSTIPENMNPLHILPVKIPLKVFVDLGTNGALWDRNQSGEKLLYDAGIQLSLMNNIIQIYFPMLYSKAYRDYFNSTVTGNKFIHNISFSIDFQNISLKTFIPQSPF
jgi:hypothetical protein